MEDFLLKNTGSSGVVASAQSLCRYSSERRRFEGLRRLQGTPFLFRGAEMISQEDEKWLKAVLTDCLDKKDEEAARDRRLEGFGMIIRGLVENIERNFDDTQRLWKLNPESPELKEKFELVRKCLFYLRRFCNEKIRDDYKKGGESG